jgi:hypothetical protein
VIGTGTEADMKVTTEDWREVNVEENREVSIEIEGTPMKASTGERKEVSIEDGEIRSDRIDFCSFAFN